MSDVSPSRLLKPLLDFSLLLKALVLRLGGEWFVWYDEDVSSTMHPRSLNVPVSGVCSFGAFAITRRVQCPKVGKRLPSIREEATRLA